jgi:hypothetical protein
VTGEVFERFRTPLYRQASWKPYIIAAMIFVSRMANARAALSGILDRADPRVL